MIGGQHRRFKVHNRRVYKPFQEDIAEAEGDIKDNTMYITLNLPRVLSFVKEGRVLSKKEGGEWALKNLPSEYHTLIETALKEYVESVKNSYDYDVAQSYARYMLNEIRKATTRSD